MRNLHNMINMKPETDKLPEKSYKQKVNNDCINAKKTTQNKQILSKNIILMRKKSEDSTAS